MRMYKDGSEVYVNKEQIDLMIKSGWSKEAPSKVDEADEPDLDGTETDETDETDTKSVKAPVKKSAKLIKK